ncbi:MBL fold metallo-hydrolase [Thermoflavimicrobium dichotomicum]|uniref:Glyoxylase, beta-lactamase superfamily II n=1 Tax=Thermoflavimicrobium dichotomicum TaxID=46223 RepID=A0A1I3LSA4_9BACL|nr:MBL fold metallo-hydrolase [Thermoflavimicrobium dichotomicum]SFI87326.1 Glyoxylase, beta-lactamase superfamily II [Thermoflavimicrobium dichotomicum]
MNKWEDIIEVALPLPFPLKIIKAYLIQGKNGYTIVDTGLKTQDSLDVWEKVRSEVGFSWTDVEKIVLTHYHPDHYGMAGTLQEMTQAPVYISETDWKQAMLFFDRKSHLPEHMADFYRKHGLPENWVKQIPDHLKGFHQWVEPHPNVQFLSAGQTIRLGDHVYEIVHTPGHADGHLSFYDAKRQILIGGDAILPKITPNISLWPECHHNPLALYFDTLNKLKEFPVKWVFPSHGPMFDHYQERIAQLEEHHNKRLQTILEFVAEKGKVTTVETCFYMFGQNLSVHNLRFAIAETLAHLEYLRYENQLVQEEQDGKFFYRRT